jgi:hypothetical protein
MTADNSPIAAPPPPEPAEAEPPPPANPGCWTRAANWLVPEANPSGAVYGAIVIGALLAAESGEHETFLDTAASAAIATALYWLAHGYATMLGRRLSDHERLTAGALVRALAHDWALVRGAAIPLLALLIAWAAGASQQTAVTAALWSTVASLIVFELIAGLRSRASAGELVLELSVGVTMGVAILALKVVLH